MNVFDYLNRVRNEVLDNKRKYLFISLKFSLGVVLAFSILDLYSALNSSGCLYVVDYSGGAFSSGL